jgi:hypothetical protein
MCALHKLMQGGAADETIAVRGACCDAGDGAWRQPEGTMREASIPMQFTYANVNTCWRKEKFICQIGAIASSDMCQKDMHF